MCAPFRNRIVCAPRFCGVALAASVLLGPAVRSQEASPHKVPVVDAGAGPCSVEMTVVDVSARPVSAVIIRVHFTHGFLGLRKKDLAVRTNVDGNARFTGLPERLDEGLYFRASKGRSKGTAFHNPAKQCHAHHFIVLHRRK